jgi:bifunctional DNase/RNase
MVARRTSPWLVAWLAVGLSPACEHIGMSDALDDSALREAAAAIRAAAPRDDTSASPKLDAIPNEAAKREGATNDPPAGYVEMVPHPKSGAFGDAVLLLDPTRERAIPIFVGGTEALSIRLRIAKQPFSRPLTHDLFDASMRRLGARMIRAQVDALRESVYLGSVVLTREGQVITLDARPSDAIALAIGNGVPIFVAKTLIDEAGIRVDEIENEKDDQAAPVAL